MHECDQLFLGGGIMEFYLLEIIFLMVDCHGYTLMRMKFDDNSALKSIVFICIEFFRGMKKNICGITVSRLRFLSVLTF